MFVYDDMECLISFLWWSGVPGIDDAISEAKSDGPAASSIESPELRRAAAEAVEVLSTALSALVASAPGSSVAGSSQALQLAGSGKPVLDQPDAVRAVLNNGSADDVRDVLGLLRYQAHGKLLCNEVAVATLVLESCDRLQHCTPAHLRSSGFGALLERLSAEYATRINTLQRGQLARHLMVIQGVIDEYTEKLRMRERSVVDAFNNMQIRNLLTATLPKIRALRKYLAKRDADAPPPPVPPPSALIGGLPTQSAIGSGSQGSFPFGVFAGWGSASSSASGASATVGGSLPSSASAQSLGAPAPPPSPGMAVATRLSAPIPVGTPVPAAPGSVLLTRPPTTGTAPVSATCSLPCPVNLTADRFLCARCDDRLKVNLRYRLGHCIVG